MDDTTRPDDPADPPSTEPLGTSPTGPAETVPTIDLARAAGAPGHGPDPFATTDLVRDGRPASGRLGPAGRVGLRVGPYTLVGPLGVGGQADVWRAFQSEPFARTVALKVLWPGYALDERRARRLLKEAEQGGLLSGPSILPVLDFGRDESGAYYLAMRLVEGFTLAQVIARRRGWLDGKPAADLPRVAVLAEAEYVQAMVRILERVTRGLAEAHAANIVHRDVKPSNILIDRDHDDRAFLADFGLAANLDDLSTAHDQHISGTIRYMGPERFDKRGAWDEVRADIYAMGVTLCEAVALDHPLDLPKNAPPAILIKAIEDGEPRRPRTLRPSLPRDLEAIILMATDRDPRRRYASAGELAADLGRFLAGEHVRARPPGPFRRILRKVARHRTAVSAAVAAVAVAVAVALAWTVARGPGPDELRRRARVAFAEGRVEAAAELVLQARDAEPSHPAKDPVAEEIADELFKQARAENEAGYTGRAERLSALCLRLGVRNAENRLTALVRDGLRQLVVSSDPAGAEVTLHSLDGNGLPMFRTTPIRVRSAGPSANPTRVHDVPAGWYWVTATVAGTSAFVERPLLLRWGRSVDTQVPLHLRPRPNSEATAGMVPVRGGSFFMGRDDPPFAPEFPRHEVKVADYALGPGEVTRGEYSDFLKASGQEDRARALWPPDGRPPADQINLPVVNLTYEQASEFAAWGGGRLPTEAELEYLSGGQGDPPGGGGAAPGLHPVGIDPTDRANTPDGAAVYGLRGNAAEMTLLHYRPYPHPMAPVHEFNTTERSGFAVRCGLGLTGQDGEPMDLGRLRRASLPFNMTNPGVGFRRARSPRPWRDDPKRGG